MTPLPNTFLLDVGQEPSQASLKSRSIFVSTNLPGGAYGPKARKFIFSEIEKILDVPINKSYTIEIDAKPIPRLGGIIQFRVILFVHE